MKNINSWNDDDDWIDRIYIRILKNRKQNVHTSGGDSVISAYRNPILYYLWVDKIVWVFFRVSLIRLDWTTYSEKKENVFFNWIYLFRRFSLFLSLLLSVSVYVRSMSSRNSLYIFDKCSSHEISMFYSNWAYFLAVRFLWFLINFLYFFSFLFAN